MGTGVNASCVLPVGEIPKWAAGRSEGIPDDLLTCVNTELGHFTSSLLPTCQEDMDFDRESSNPGQYHFEKLVSGYAMGDVCRRIMLSLASEGGLFLEQPTDLLKAAGSFSTASLSTIDGDTSEGLKLTINTLRDELKV